MAMTCLLQRKERILINDCSNIFLALEEGAILKFMLLVSCRFCEVSDLLLLLVQAVNKMEQHPAAVVIFLSFFPFDISSFCNIISCIAGQETN